jgi:hypothetical protein
MPENIEKVSPCQNYWGKQFQAQAHFPEYNYSPPLDAEPLPD